MAKIHPWFVEWRMCSGGLCQRALASKFGLGAVRRFPPRGLHGTKRRERMGEKVQLVLIGGKMWFFHPPRRDDLARRTATPLNSDLEVLLKVIV
jgi:hypothetical protein